LLGKFSGKDRNKDDIIHTQHQLEYDEGEEGDQCFGGKYPTKIHGGLLM
jgi:hypothetical protein